MTNKELLKIYKSQDALKRKSGSLKDRVTKLGEQIREIENKLSIMPRISFWIDDVPIYEAPGFTNGYRFCSANRSVDRRYIREAHVFLNAHTGKGYHVRVRTWNDCINDTLIGILDSKEDARKLALNYIVTGMSYLPKEKI